MPQRKNAVSGHIVLDGLDKLSNDAGMKLLQEKWPTVRAAAETLGINEEAMRKWQERKSIPSRWHVRLIMASNGALQLDDFMQQNTEDAA